MVRKNLNGVLRLVLYGCIFSAGCVHNTTITPITLPNGKPGFTVDCTTQGWPYCFQLAGKQCPGGYVIHERSMSVQIESDIPVEELKAKQQDETTLAPVSDSIKPPRLTDKYMVFSCK